MAGTGDAVSIRIHFRNMGCWCYCGFSSKRIRSVFTTGSTIWLASRVAFLLALAAIALGFITNSRTLSLFTFGTFSSIAGTSSKALATQRYERIIENIILFIIAGSLDAYIMMFAAGIGTLLLKNRFIGLKKKEKVIGTLLVLLIIASSSSIIMNERANRVPLSADTSSSIQEMNGVSSILSHFYSSGIGGEVGPILFAVKGDLAGGNAHPSAYPLPSVVPHSLRSLPSAT